MIFDGDTVVWPRVAYENRQRILDSIPSFLTLSDDERRALKPGGNVIAAIESSDRLSALDLEITSLENDATWLLAAIREKKYTSVQVLTAFWRRACLSHQYINCLVEIFFEDAVRRAQELDEYYETTGKLIGPLHGLPISLKESYPLKDHVITCGLVAFLENPPAKTSAHVVEILAQAGAVFYARTNLPQVIMQLEAESLWGKTLNPHNTLLTPGGSSGGCAALVSSGGSPLSVGGDIGGSLRTPSANCGLWTLKATTLRLPRKGGSNLMPGNDGVGATTGPIARSARDVSLFFQVILGSEPWSTEPELPPVPWRAVAPNKFKVGVLWDDGVVKTLPPVARAMSATVAALQRHAQFEVVDFKPLNHENGVAMTHKLYFADGGECVKALIEQGNEPLLPLTQWVLDRPGVKKVSIEEWWQLVDARDKFKAAYNAYFLSLDIDVILCPSGPGAAPLLGDTSYWGYTCIWNLLDWPASIFPTGLQTSSLDSPAETRTEFWSEYDRAVHTTYKPSAMGNAPIGLQLVGPRYSDEKIMAIVELLSADILPLV